MLRLLVLLGIVLAAPVQAQIGPPTDYVRWDAAGPEAPVSAGATTEVTIRAAIEAGWKMYAMDSPRPSRGVTIDVEALPPGFSLQEIVQSEPDEGYDPNFDITVRTFEREAAFTVRLATAADVASRTHEVGGTIGFMICNDRLCLPPTTVPFEADVPVRQASLATEGQAPAPTTPSLFGQVPTGGTAEKVSWTATVEPDAVRPGQTAELVLAAEVESGWKMYALDAVPPGKRGPVPVTPSVDAARPRLPYTRCPVSRRRRVRRFA